MKSQVRVVNQFDVPELVLPSGKKVTFQNREAWVDPATLFEICANPYALRHLQPEPLAEHDPSSWTAKRRQLHWDGGNSTAISFGYVALKMIEALDAQGVEVFVTQNGVPLGNEMSPRLREILTREPSYSTWAVRHAKQDHDWMLPVTHRIRFTMWEWDRVPKPWIDNINRFNKLLIVPSTQQARLYQAEGVTLPVAVVPHGVDPNHYTYRKPTPHPLFTFGTMGYHTRRKGIDVLVRAFSDEFAKTEDVRLVIKTSNPSMADLPPPTPKVEVIRAFSSQAEIAELLASFDVGVFPARGEGFGLGGLELMATGRTVICTNWGGMTDYLDPKFNYALDYKIEMPQMEFPRSFGEGYHPRWAEPSYEHLRQLMRHCYDHRDEVEAKGRAASRWVRDHWTWSRAAKKLIDAVDQVAGLSKPKLTVTRKAKGVSAAKKKRRPARRPIAPRRRRTRS